MLANTVYSFGLSTANGGIKSQQPVTLPAQNSEPAALHEKYC